MIRSDSCRQKQEKKKEPGRHREKMLKKEVERVRQDAEQERNNYLRGMVEAKIPVETISSILHMSVDAVRKQALLLGCVL